MKTLTQILFFAGRVGLHGLHGLLSIQIYQGLHLAAFFQILQSLQISHVRKDVLCHLPRLALASELAVSV